MNKQEAMRRVCHGAAKLLDNGSANEWLGQEDGELGGGAPLSEADEARMRKAFDKLIEELARRGTKRAIE